MMPGSGTVVDARTSLALWLRDGRARKKLSLDDVARITKIQTRILDKLERGELEGLPAEVFVKGFVKSFARCVGLDEGEALDRYSQCRAQTSQSHVARALVETMSQLAPVAARSAAPIEVVEVIDVAPPLAADELIEVRAKGSIVDVPAMVEAPVADASLVEPPIVESPVVEAAPVAEAPAIEAAPVVEAAPATESPVVAADGEAPAKKKRTRKKAVNADGTPKAPRTRKKKATPVEAAPVVVAPIESTETAVEAAPVEAPVVEIAVEAAPAIEAPVERSAVESNPPAIELSVEPAPRTSAIEVIDATVDSTVSAEGSGPTHGTWRPTMPPLSTISSMPWRRPAMPSAPSLVIDDADPDRAEREQDERASARDHRVSFLPPILLDREDRSARQGGLTLAVIILLIAATLTLSYLMRRPSVSGNGVTMREVPATLA